MRILGVPLENGLGKTKGTAEAPAALLAELRGRTSDAEWEQESLTLDLSDVEEASAQVERRFSAILANSPALAIGGDHASTYPLFRAFARRHPGAGLMVLDAHPDMMHSLTPPTHEDYLLTLLSEGTLAPERVVLAGLRSAHPLESERMRKMRIRHFPMQEIQDEGLRHVTDALMSAARDWPALYLSVDIDVLDPAFAPGTGYPEPGGLSTRELLYLLRRIAKLQMPKAADLVEVNPLLDPGRATVRAGAAILLEILNNFYLKVANEQKVL
ncbi:arginase family protein [Candidatus Woesearchaeota archaeon]|nr:arginase family protein [Candidatus Woesearchaeota archaeon]